MEDTPVRHRRSQRRNEDLVPELEEPLDPMKVATTEPVWSNSSFSQAVPHSPVPYAYPASPVSPQVSGQAMQYDQPPQTAPSVQPASMRSPRSGRRSLQAGDARTSAAGRSYPVQTLPSYPEQVFRTSAPRDSVNTSRSPETLRPVRETHRLPGWTIALLIVCVVLALGLFTAKTVMNGYLRQQEEARQAAHTALLDAHPYHYETLIRQYAGIYNLHSAYVAAIILNESAFDPRAVSSAGARGLMQLMPDTAEWIAGKLRDSSYSFERMYDPETNIRYGCWYLNYLSGLFSGDPVAVTSAYHAGQGTVRTWLADGVSSTDGGKTLNLDTMPEGPTRTYARRVTNAYAIYDALYDHVLNPLPVPSDPT